MDKPTRDPGTSLFLLGIFILFLALAGWHGYWAREQSALYRREGIEVTTWECFIGVKPAERTIRIKE